MRLPLTIVILSFAAVPVSAEPIRLLATGIVDQAWNYGQLPPDFTSLIGTPWEPEFTVETDTLGVAPWSHHPATYNYNDAVSDARFQLGSATYYSAEPADAFVNAYRPDLGFGPALGFVQYHWWPGVWTDAPPGGLDLNYPEGFLILSYYDANATAGNLPLSPVFTSAQYRGFDWRLQFGYNYGGFRSHEMSLTPVPEPGTLALLGIGLAGSLASRARSRKRHQ